MSKDFQIILASASPRRRELLTQAHFIFHILPSHKEEIITSTIPHEVVLELAYQKAEDVFQICTKKTSDLPFCIEKEKSLVVIGSDTIVAKDSEILGKPKNLEDAKRMLKMLSNNTHQVYTGVCIYYLNPKNNHSEHICFYEKTDVSLYAISDAELDDYLSNPSDWQDKAGAYGIQETFGAKYVKSISGDYYNVVGLPIARLYHELNNLSR